MKRYLLTILVLAANLAGCSCSETSSAPSLDHAASEEELIIEGENGLIKLSALIWPEGTEISAKVPKYQSSGQLYGSVTESDTEIIISIYDPEGADSFGYIAQVIQDGFNIDPSSTYPFYSARNEEGYLIQVDQGTPGGNQMEIRLYAPETDDMNR